MRARELLWHSSSLGGTSFSWIDETLTVQIAIKGQATKTLKYLVGIQIQADTQARNQYFLFVIVGNLPDPAGDRERLPRYADLFPAVDYNTDLALLNVEDFVLAQMDVSKGTNLRVAQSTPLYKPLRWRKYNRKSLW